MPPALDTSRPGWRFVFTGVLVLAMVAATQMPAGLGILAPFMRDDLGISRTQIGVLITTAVVAGADMIFVANFGYADGLGGDPWFGWDAGGGIYVDTAAATIKHNRITDNSADSYFGGGMYLNNSDSFVIDNIISYNFADTGGGVGIWFSDAVLERNLISSNSGMGV